jgi:uncharacterized protein
VTHRRKIKLKCPSCKQLVKSNTENIPFCSERCRLIDLGKWASGQYVVSSPLRDTSDQVNAQSFPGETDED